MYINVYIYLIEIGDFCNKSSQTVLQRLIKLSTWANNIDINSVYWHTLTQEVDFMERKRNYSKTTTTLCIVLGVFLISLKMDQKS